jgi:hypothetical protein
MGFSARILSLLQGPPFGSVFPVRDEPPRALIDGRTAGLRILADYISELTFFRPGAVGSAPIAFKIKRDDIQVDAFPDAARDLVFPSIVFTPGRGVYSPIGLNAFVDESSVDVYGKGSVLMWMSEYTETVTLEIWAAYKPERRSILVGLEQALSPTEFMYGLRFFMPDYYGQLVCFTLSNRQNIDDASGAKTRRRAHMELEMRYTVVALMNYNDLRTQIVVETADPSPSAAAVIDVESIAVVDASSTAGEGTMIVDLEPEPGS